MWAVNDSKNISRTLPGQKMLWLPEMFFVDAVYSISFIESVQGKTTFARSNTWSDIGPTLHLKKMQGFWSNVMRTQWRLVDKAGSKVWAFGQCLEKPRQAEQEHQLQATNCLCEEMLDFLLVFSSWRLKVGGPRQFWWLAQKLEYHPSVWWHQETAKLS